MSAIATVLRRIAAVPVFVACIALFALMVLTFCDVVLRSVLNAPIEAASELTRVLMAIVVFSVLPVMSSRGDHIAVDLTDGLFRRFRLSRIRDGVLYLGSGVAVLWPAERVWILAERSRSYGDVTEYLNLPLFYIGWFIAASVTLTAVVMILTGVVYLVAPRLISEIRA